MRVRRHAAAFGVCAALALPVVAQQDHSGHDEGHGAHDPVAQDAAVAGEHAGHGATGQGSAAAAAAEHAGHGMGHGAGSPAAEGDWAYTGRDNPKPHTENRWEMVPVPGYGHMFVSTEGLSPQTVCAALANPGVMVDEATRAKCGFPARPSNADAPAQPGGAAQHGDHGAMGH